MSSSEPHRRGHEAPAPTERPARPGEKCKCGRPAVIVYITERFGEVGYCGIPDGGQKAKRGARE